jgi:drug/metabolite transporter (DMT)-like permease
VSSPVIAAYLALLVQTAISAGTYLLAKRAMSEVTPFTLVMCRFVLSAPLFMVLLAFTPPPRLPPRRAFLKMVGLGALAGPANQGLFFFGLSRSTPAHAALLYALTPAGVFLYAWAKGQERATPRLLVGIGVAFMGVVVLLLGRGLGAAAGPLLGDVIILAAVAAWSAYTAEGRAVIAEHGFYRGTAWTMTLGALLTFPAAPFLLDVPSVLRASAVTWSAIAYLAVMTSVVSYFLWYFALAKMAASRVAVFSNLQPVATALAAWAFLGERLTWEIAVGGALVLAGVWLTQDRSRTGPAADARTGG